MQKVKQGREATRKNLTELNLPARHRADRLVNSQLTAAQPLCVSPCAPCKSALQEKNKFVRVRRDTTITLKRGKGRRNRVLSFCSCCSRSNEGRAFVFIHGFSRKIPGVRALFRIVL